MTDTAAVELFPGYDPYLVWSHEHRAWWRPSRRGYTTSIKDAGRYTRDEAIQICCGGGPGGNGWSGKEPPNEIPVRVFDAMECVPEASDGETPDKESK